MADESEFYEVSSEDDDHSVEIDADSKKIGGGDGTGAGFDGSAMVRKLEELKSERVCLERENGEIRERLRGMTLKIEELSNEKSEMGERLREMGRKIDESKSDRKALEAVAARAADLETEVSRLQHDLVSSMGDGEEAASEVLRLNGVLAEKVLDLEIAEKEKARLQGEVEKAKAELESVAAQLKNAGSERLRIEEGAEAMYGKKESEISELKKRIVELESVVSKNALELEKEMDVAVGAKNDAVETAGSENLNVGALESKLSRVVEELDESKRVIQELMNKAAQGANGLTSVARGEVVGSDAGGLKGVKMQWPAAVAVSAGAFLTVACMVYLQSAKRR